MSDDNPFAEVIARLRSDPEHWERVDAHEQERLDKLRPARRHRAAIYQRLNGNKVSIRKSVAWAVKAGNLQKPRRCQMHDSAFCSGPVEAHHWAGYEHRYRFHLCWLCRRHHRLIDAGKMELPSELCTVQILTPGYPPRSR